MIVFGHVVFIYGSLFDAHSILAPSAFLSLRKDSSFAELHLEILIPTLCVTLEVVGGTAVRGKEARREKKIDPFFQNSHRLSQISKMVVKT